MEWSFDSLIEPPTLPQKALIYASPKVGKSELMATYPKTVVMAFENPGPTLAGRKDIKITPLIRSLEDALGFLRFLYKEKHDFKTLGIDTITRASRIFESQIVATPNKDGIYPKGMGDALGGYGKSFNYLSEMHSKIVLACEALNRDRGMYIVWLAHDTVTKFTPPDSESYNYYSLDMHEDSAAHYINNADVIAYLDMKTIRREGEDGKTKVGTTGDRTMRIKQSPAYVSGNRYGITEDFVFKAGENPLLNYLDASRVNPEDCDLEVV